MKGKRIVFTGALMGGTRKQAAARAQKYGCIVLAGVSKHVDIVIAADGAGQKLDRAEELGARTPFKMSKRIKPSFGGLSESPVPWRQETERPLLKLVQIIADQAFFTPVRATRCVG